jgi:hypothetical protein
MNKESQIMITSRKISSCDHKSKMLKSSSRSLLKTIMGATKVTYNTLMNRIPRRWTHVNLLKKLTIKKCIFYIKLRDRSTI